MGRRLDTSLCRAHTTRFLRVACIDPADAFDTDRRSEAPERWLCWHYLRCKGHSYPAIAASTTGGAHTAVMNALRGLQPAIYGKFDPVVNDRLYRRVECDLPTFLSPLEAYNRLRGLTGPLYGPGDHVWVARDSDVETARVLSYVACQTPHGAWVNFTQGSPAQASQVHLSRPEALQALLERLKAEVARDSDARTA